MLTWGTKWDTMTKCFSCLNVTVPADLGLQSPVLCMLHHPHWPPPCDTLSHLMNWNKALPVNVIQVAMVFSLKCNLQSKWVAHNHDLLQIRLALYIFDNGPQNTEQVVRCKWPLQMWQWFMYEHHHSDARGCQSHQVPNSTGRKKKQSFIISLSADQRDVVFYNWYVSMQSISTMWLYCSWRSLWWKSHYSILLWWLFCWTCCILLF